MSSRESVNPTVKRVAETLQLSHADILGDLGEADCCQLAGAAIHALNVDSEIRSDHSISPGSEHDDLDTVGFATEQMKLDCPAAKEIGEAELATLATTAFKAAAPRLGKPLEVIRGKIMVPPGEILIFSAGKGDYHILAEVEAGSGSGPGGMTVKLRKLFYAGPKAQKGNDGLLFAGTDELYHPAQEE